LIYFRCAAGESEIILSRSAIAKTSLSNCT
jgi:hypothetical protein